MLMFLVLLASASASAAHQSSSCSRQCVFCSHWGLPHSQLIWLQIRGRKRHKTWTGLSAGQHKYYTLTQKGPSVTCKFSLLSADLRKERKLQRRMLGSQQTESFHTGGTFWCSAHCVSVSTLLLGHQRDFSRTALHFIQRSPQDLIWAAI